MTQNAYVLVVDGGNTYWGATPSSSTVRSAGLVVGEAMNLMGYQAMSLGAIDLQLGEEALRQLMEKALFPVLSANVVVQRTGELLALPYTWIEIGNRQLGVIGVTRGPDAQSDAGAQAGGLAISDPLAAVAAAAEELLARTDLILVLDDLDREANLRLAELVPSIDVILSCGGQEVINERLQSPTTGAVIWQLGLSAREFPGWMVSHLRLHFDSAGIVLDQGSDMTRLDVGYLDEPAVQQLIAGYDAE